MAKYPIVAEFIDAKTGVRRKPGEVIEASGKRLDALKAAKVIGDEVREPKGKDSKNDPDGPKTDELAAKDGDPDGSQANNSTGE